MSHRETSQAPVQDGISHSESALGCSVNHWFSSSPGHPRLQTLIFPGRWEEGFTYTALELQKAKFAPVCCKPALLPSQPSISKHQSWSQWPYPAGKGTAGLAFPPLKHKLQKGSSFVMA